MIERRAHFLNAEVRNSKIPLLVKAKGTLVRAINADFSKPWKLKFAIIQEVFALLLLLFCFVLGEILIRIVHLNWTYCHLILPSSTEP